MESHQFFLQFCDNPWTSLIAQHPKFLQMTWMVVHLDDVGAPWNGGQTMKATPKRGRMSEEKYDASENRKWNFPVISSD